MLVASQSVDDSRALGGALRLIAELEGRMAEPLRRAADLGHLIDLGRRYRNDLDRFTFDERRLALRALGFKASANGDDPARWRHEAGVALAGACRVSNG